MSQYIDTGIDYNRDNHCDIEGYFLNKEKSHKGILRKGNEKSLVLKKKLEEEFDLDYNPQIFYFPTLRELELYVPYLKRYSLNNENDSYSSPRINRILRNGYRYFDIATNKTIWNLDMATKMFKTKKDMYVFRGIGGVIGFDNYLLKIARLKIGDEYSDNAFLSTSTNLFSACKFADAGKNDLVVILKMKLPSGTECVPIMCNNKKENEILLGRDKHFRIIKKDSSYVAGKIIVSITVHLEE